MQYLKEIELLCTLRFVSFILRPSSCQDYTREGHSEVERAVIVQSSFLLIDMCIVSTGDQYVSLQAKNKGSVVKMACKTPTWSSTSQVTDRCRHRNLPLYLNASFQSNLDYAPLR